MLWEMSDDVVIDQEDDSIDDESSVRGRSEASVENWPAWLPYGLPDAVWGGEVPLLPSPAVPLQPGLDDVLRVGRHPGADPSQTSSYEQPEVVVLSVSGEKLKGREVAAEGHRLPEVGECQNSYITAQWET